MILEIAPYHRPIAPKGEGFNVKTLDFLPTEELLLRAANDAAVMPYINDIEPVDIVASATDLLEVMKIRNEEDQYSTVISSHNIEHLPNPIKFLKGCGFCLKPGGALSMAVPDKRHTFDSRRNLTKTSDLLRAYHLNKESPDAFDIFDFESNFFVAYGELSQFKEPISVSYERMKVRLNSPALPYSDIHNHVYTKESFWLIMTELTLLQEIPLTIIDIISNGFEFIVHFKILALLNLIPSLFRIFYRQGRCCPQLFPYSRDGLHPVQ